MRDLYGDQIRVMNTDHHVYVIFENDDKWMDMSLTPKQARKLAQKLMLAAQEIECSQRLAALKRD